MSAPSSTCSMIERPVGCSYSIGSSIVITWQGRELDQPVEVGIAQKDRTWA